MPDAQQPPSSSLHSVLLLVTWQEIPSPLLTELTKKLILLPKCRCFKHTFDLEHEDLFQLMAHGWLTPLELSSTVAGPCFCLLAHHCRAALCDGSFTELLLTELFSWALRPAWYLCSQPWRGCVPLPGRHRADELNVNLVSCLSGEGGIDGDGDITRPENINAFRNFVLDNTDHKGVHFLMADGVGNLLFMG